MKRNFKITAQEPNLSSNGLDISGSQELLSLASYDEIRGNHQNADNQNTFELHGEKEDYFGGWNTGVSYSKQDNFSALKKMDGVRSPIPGK